MPRRDGSTAWRNPPAHLDAALPAPSIDKKGAAAGRVERPARLFHLCTRFPVPTFSCSCCDIILPGQRQAILPRVRFMIPASKLVDLVAVKLGVFAGAKK